MKLSLLAVRKEYQDADRNLVVIDSLTWEATSRQSIAIIGRSGVGKSTFLQLVGLLDRPSSGKILFDGVSLDEASAEERASFRGSSIGFVFQSQHLLGEFTALENVSMPLTIAGVPPDQAQFRAEEALKRVGLSERLTHRPGALSGGEQQRVALARATVTRPKLLLADEPTGNLDSENSQVVQGLLQELKSECESLLIVVTHSRELAQSFDAVFEMGPCGVLSPVEK